MRTTMFLAAVLASGLMACSGTDGTALSQADTAFLQQVSAEAAAVDYPLVDEGQLEPQLKDVIGKLERSSDQFAMESQRLLGDVQQQVQSLPSTQALVEQAQEAVQQAKPGKETRAWVEALISQQEALLQAAQAQIETSTNPEVIALAERVYREQLELVTQLRNELPNLP